MIKIFHIIPRNIWGLFLGMLILSSCSSPQTEHYYLVLGNKANEVEISTAEDLKSDLSKVLELEGRIISDIDNIPKGTPTFILGTPKSNSLIASLVKKKAIILSEDNPGPRGGIWHKTKLKNKQEAIVLAGSDVQGFQYAVYDYSKEILGIDPLEYWTGKKALKKTNLDLVNFENRRIAPPKVPILCYFENDVDELANYRGKLLEYDWESYTQMINSLVRLRYNAIQFFDMLGRPEFFIRPEYKELNPNYQIDIEYLDKMIDYAHQKGMKVQIDFALGYQIHPMSEDKATCWRDYKEEWVKAWKYYLEETPLKKTDIFILRPRHQVWDWEYESTCGENKIEVFNDVYKVFGELVDQYKPNADKVLICYSDGMEMWNDGFRPPKDWIVAWSDDGFGDFEHLPNTTDGYNFGTYMHAGFWLNHTVHNPYPETVETVMKNMFQDYDADKYCLVNGQNFRPFLLNLEAYSAVCQDPDSFDYDDFYKQWAKRYFKENQRESAISSMKLLHEAQEGRIGYVQHLWEIRESISYLSDSPIERPGKTPVPHDFKRVENDLEHVKKTQNYIQQSLETAEKGLDKKDLEADFYYSYVYLPALLYNDLISFEASLHNMALLKKQYEDTGKKIYIKQALDLWPEINQKLEVIYQNRNSGDKEEKWANWYSPEIRRPNNGFPTIDMLTTIKLSLEDKL
ncbi:glycosyl hydrolase 115 family protein [Arenibacter algicola]|uniref:glycosyl hydrolase 115 family protein n=1 Tax=Arenibacter algicola TaxID=616991 RepID=UPI001C06879C|nr:glycosyl hydrolase 115 family protein [Arenibacter algicola]MBU2905786.1 glycosyl hydrolase 115 family protein [Arenibacter algicola]